MKIVAPDSSRFISHYESLLTLINVTPQEKRELFWRIEVIEYQKKELILKQGVVCTGIFYISSGFCRFSLKTEAGDDNTLHFGGHGDFVTNIEALLFKSPSPYSIQAMEKNILVFIPFQTIDWVCNNIANGEKFVSRLWEKYCVAKTEEIYSLHIPQPQRRYEQLIRRFPDINQKVSQKVIASYLNITPQYFSYLKAKTKDANQNKS